MQILQDEINYQCNIINTYNRVEPQIQDLRQNNKVENLNSIIWENLQTCINWAYLLI